MSYYRTIITTDVVFQLSTIDLPPGKNQLRLNMNRKSSVTVSLQPPIISFNKVGRVRRNIGLCFSANCTCPGLLALDKYNHRNRLIVTGPQLFCCWFKVNFIYVSNVIILVIQKFIPIRTTYSTKYSIRDGKMGTAWVRT